MARRKSLILALFFISICMIFSACSTKKNNTVKMQTYSDKNFNFSVEFPDNWGSKVIATWEATSTQEGSPDGGIDIYVEGNKNNLISVYGQLGHISMVLPNFNSTEFVTDSGDNGVLYSQTIGNRKEMHLIFDDDFHAAHINVSSHCFEKNEKEIIAVLKSINIISRQ